MAKIKFESDSREVRNNLKNFKRRLEIVVTGQIDYHAALGTGYMKVNAPWTDRTSAARTSLHATPIHAPGSSLWEIVFAHGVKYGFWLEVAHSGRYRIIIPATLNIGHQFMRNLEGSLGKI